MEDHHQQLGSLRRTNGALLLLVLVLAVAQVGGGLPRVAAAGEAGSNQMFAVTAPGQGAGNNVLFVIDPATTRLMVYEHRAGGRLELVTIRNMEFDLPYQEWSPAPGRATTPSVAEMRKR